MNTTILVAIITSIVSPISVLLVKQWLHKKTAQKTTASIKEHTFFSEMSYMQTFMIPKICIKEDIKRSKLVRKFLHIKFTAIEKHLNDLTNKVIQGEHIGTQEYSECIINIVKDYEKNALEKGLPEVFIRKFSDWHTPKIHIIKDLIVNINKSGIYSTNVEVHSAFLDTIVTILHLTILDSETVISKMNGELSPYLDEI